jgi:hypothetical protein
VREHTHRFPHALRRVPFAQQRQSTAGISMARGGLRLLQLLCSLQVVLSPVGVVGHLLNWSRNEVLNLDSRIC